MRNLLLRCVPPALLSGLGGCAGIFQHTMPAEPASYAVVAEVGPVLRVGSAERDVTPPVGCYMAGFDIGRTSTTVASPLEVRALVVEAATRRFAIIGIDNLGLLREDVDWIKAGLPGFANGDVFLCASHTHAGPDLIGLWGYYLLSSGRDREYLARVRAATAEAVAEARAKAAPARFVHGQAMLPPQGLVKNANRRGVFDRRVDVLQAQAIDDGRPLGSLLHLACHPEVLPRRNTALSADFVGALCDAWRERGHGQAVFVNGALGAMISPDVRPRDVTGVLAFGKVAADCCEAALAAAVPLPVDSIEVRRRDVYLPLVSVGFQMGRLTTVLERELYSGEARSTVGYLRLGTFEAVAVPGEMEPVLAERIRQQLRRPELVIFGLCDDEVGYLLREQDARDPEFAYERSMSPSRSAGERVSAAIIGWR
ncbi:MAG TPA: hypothetical protein VFZ65_04905 [Planctomycetota bacterium]|nr:hypothetical protein [Planctomycetota bacterium]